MANLTFDASEQLFERMCRVMPAGSTRTTTFYSPYPVAIARGSGYLLVDVDGNEYIDLLGNYSSLVHGQAHPAITEAVIRAAEAGCSNPAPLEIQAELAERICARVPSVSKVRFMNSGTEAVMIAIRAARAVTGRDRLLKAVGGYHGSWEQVAIGSSEAQDVAARDVGADRGVPAAIGDMLCSVAYNDIAQLEAAVVTYGDELAAILLEPVLGHVIEPASEAYLRRARELADECGALLILDEVITLRLHLGGVQTKLGIMPDLTTMGKIIGGGLPVGAVGGRDELMAIFDPRTDGAIEHHGTFNGNALTMAAGVASLDLLPQNEIDRINDLGERLAEGLSGLLRNSGLGVALTSCGSIMNIRGEAAGVRALHRAALESGVFMAPRGMICISTVMDEAVIDEVMARLEATVDLAGNRAPASEAAWPRTASTIRSRSA
jgi:glutamate-1-semialdehyde 2,1-aminomutase